MKMSITVILADYADANVAKDIAFLLNHYAEDPMGGGTSLPEAIQQNLAAKLAQVPNAFSVLCYVNDQAAGLINCFQGFSTFQCKPLINIHDISVHREFRGRGISQLMLAKVEAIARQRDCCKLTLEVIEGNQVAQQAYVKYGFAGYQLDATMGSALFWQKSL